MTREEEQQIDDEIGQLSLKELDGAWRRLCGNIALQTASMVAPHSKPRSERWWSREQREQRIAAKRWLEGGDAVITYEECVQTLHLSPELFRKTLETSDRDVTSRHLRRAQIGRSVVKLHEVTTKDNVATDLDEQEPTDNELLRQTA